MGFRVEFCPILWSLYVCLEECKANDWMHDTASIKAKTYYIHRKRIRLHLQELI